MNQKEEDKKQRELIRAFDRELFTYTGQIAWFAPGFFSFIALGLIAIPYQELVESGDFPWWIMIFLSFWITFLVLQPYQNSTDAFTPQKKVSKTYDKLRCLPVDKKQYRIVRMGYLFRYFWKLTVIGLCMQCITSWIAGTLGIQSILYVIIVLFVVPMIEGGLQLLEN